MAKKVVVLANGLDKPEKYGTGIIVFIINNIEYKFD